MTSKKRLNNIVPVVALRDFGGLVLFAVGRGVVEFQILDADAGVGVDGACDEGVSADDCVFTYDGIAAENGGSCVNGDIVQNCRVALFARKSLAASRGKSSQRNALINLHILADDCGFANHNAGTVVDKEVLADGCTRMDVNARFGVGVFCHESRENRNMQKVEFMGNAVDGRCHEAGIGEDDFVEAAGCGVAVISGVQIRFQEFTDLRNLGEKFFTNSITFDLAFIGSHSATKFTVIQCNRHLFVKVVEGIFDKNRKGIFGVINLVRTISEVSWINDSNQILQYRLNLGLIGSIVNIDIVDMLAAIVIVENNLYGFFDFGFLDKFVHKLSRKK